MAPDDAVDIVGSLTPTTGSPAESDDGKDAGSGKARDVESGVVEPPQLPSEKKYIAEPLSKVESGRSHRSHHLLTSADRIAGEIKTYGYVPGVDEETRKRLFKEEGVRVGLEQRHIQMLALAGSE